MNLPVPGTNGWSPLNGLSTRDVVVGGIALAVVGVECSIAMRLSQRCILGTLL